MKPTTAIALFGIIASLDWQKLTANDRAAFLDAGDDARIAQISDTNSARIAEMLDLRATGPLMAIIGGDGLQIEIHGTNDLGEPLDWCMPIPTAIGF